MAVQAVQALRRSFSRRDARTVGIRLSGIGCSLGCALSCAFVLLRKEGLGWQSLSIQASIFIKIAGVTERIGSFRCSESLIMLIKAINSGDGQVAFEYLALGPKPQS